MATLSDLLDEEGNALRGGGLAAFLSKQEEAKGGAESDWQDFLRAAAAGGFDPARVIQNPDGTGNHFLPIDASYAGMPGVVDMGGQFYVPSNLLNTIPGYENYGRSESFFSGVSPFLNPVSAMNDHVFGDEVGGHLTELFDPGATVVRNVDLAANAGNFTGNPFGAEATGWDYLGGGNQADSAGSRDIGRTVGSIFGLSALGNLANAGMAGGTGSETVIGDAAADELATELATQQAIDGSAQTIYSAGAGGTAGTTLAGAGTTAAGGAAAGTALSRIIDGNGTLADYLSVGGNILGPALGVYGADQASDAYGDLAGQLRADRLPFLNQSVDWLNDPNAYFEGPGKAALDANLRALSIHGNPATSPWALGTANEAALKNWQNAVLGFATPGLAGVNTAANVSGKSIDADAGVYNAIGSGIANLTNPQPTILDLIKAMGGNKSSTVSL